MILAGVLFWITAISVAAGLFVSELSLQWSGVAWAIGKAAGVLLLAVVLAYSGVRRGIPKRNAAQ